MNQHNNTTPPLTHPQYYVTIYSHSFLCVTYSPLDGHTSAQFHQEKKHHHSLLSLVNPHLASKLHNRVLHNTLEMPQTLRLSLPIYLRCSCFPVLRDDLGSHGIVLEKEVGQRVTNPGATLSWANPQQLITSILQNNNIIILSH